MKATNEQKHEMRKVVVATRHQLKLLSTKLTRENQGFSKTHDKWGTIASLKKVYSDLIDINQFLN